MESASSWLPPHWFRSYLIKLFTDDSSDLKHPMILICNCTFFNARLYKIDRWINILFAGGQHQPMTTLTPGLPGGFCGFSVNFEKLWSYTQRKFYPENSSTVQDTPYGPPNNWLFCAIYAQCLHIHMDTKHSVRQDVRVPVHHGNLGAHQVPLEPL